ncbi:hypothetical protein NIES4074_02660 [Cylindrospermum sp. NIES-4074]|nr:hypothetical protein NIES4074_02660 [Cylindrospermum sp. NIES-4074]
MDINIPLMKINKSLDFATLGNFQEANKEDIETITQVLSKITSRTPEQIKPYLDAILDS